MTKNERIEMLELMKEIISPINGELTKINGRLTKIEIKIENEVDRSVKVTMEGHTDLNRKMDKALALENRVETLENKMSAVEYVLQNNEQTKIGY